jgi:hypothetical protein
MEGQGKIELAVGRDFVVSVLVVQMEIVVRLANKILIRGEYLPHLEQLH